MLTNQNLAILSLSFLALCFLTALFVFVAKLQGKALAIVSGISLLSMILVTILSAILVLG